MQHRQAAQLGRQGEYDVEVTRRERARYAGFDPDRLSQDLALGAVTVSLRVVIILPLPGLPAYACMGYS